jgi:hypothetical protein
VSGTKGATFLGLAKAEASLLTRSALVLAGLPAGALVIWFFNRSGMPLWWEASWLLGGGQLILGMAVLAAAQLATWRARRNAMADLYASFPATAATRTLAHLAGLLGAVPASLLLAGAATALVQARGAVGAPSIPVLADGLLLVIAAGAAGVAIGTVFPHPLAGVLGALALLLSSEWSHMVSGAAIWLSPWETGQDQLAGLPGPLVGYPPVGPHALELAGLAVLAGVVALAVTVRRLRAWGALTAAGVIAVAAICFAGALQLRPIPAAGLDRLVSEVADPASVQSCTTAANQVSYCLYPGFGSLLPSLEAPVSAVLAHLPAGGARGARGARPTTPLTVSQVVLLSAPDPNLTYGHPAREVSGWDARLERAPGNLSATPGSAIYLPVGNWPAGGGQLADAQFSLAVATAEWAVHLPGTSDTRTTTGGFLQCVPLDQAREAIAIWLAILATHPPTAELRGGLGNSAGFTGSVVRGTFVPGWNYPGTDGGYVTPPGGGAVTTAAGYLLASAMTSLPEQQVSHVLAGAWSRWLNWRTTDAQLAAALGIRMPSSPTPPPGPINGPQNPLCT